MSAGFPRIYRSFAEFEREEIRKLDSLHTTIDDMLEERFAEEVEADADVSGPILFDRRRGHRD